MSILLVRHGETALNVARVLQPADTPLCARGLRQAEQLALRLGSEEIEHVLCSDLPRARMTAQPLLDRTGLGITATALLRERNFGDLRGTPYTEIGADPFGPDFVPPNGESWDAFHLRVAQAFALMLEHKRKLTGKLVVMTHGLVCRALLHRHLGSAAGVALIDRFDNASVTEIDATAPHLVRLLNSTTHLEGDAADGGSAHGAA